MKATTLLEKQHRKVEALFKKLEGGRAEAAPLLTELANELCAHMAIEQTIFYPAIRAIDPDLVMESYEEHAVAEIELKRLLATNATDPSFKAKVTTLKELIEHHVGEEEDDLFPKVEKKLGAEKLEVLGKRMKIDFEATVESGYEAVLAKGRPTTADRSNRESLRHAHG